MSESGRIWNSWKGKSGVEIGAGLGLPSKGASDLGVKMTATDGDDTVLQLLGMNTERNAPSPSCKVQKLLWGSGRTEFFWSSDQAHPSLKKADAYRSLGVSLSSRVRNRIPFTRRLTLSLTVR